MPVYTSMYGTKHHLEKATDSMDADDDNLEAYRNPPPTLRNEPMSETGEEHKKVQTFQPIPRRKLMKPLEPIKPNE